MSWLVDRTEHQCPQLLGELDPVAVRVVDVEEAHLARQLDDDPDLDARLAQPVGLRLQVGRRRRARRPSSLGSPSASPISISPRRSSRPALVEVDGELLEAERSR